MTGVTMQEYERLEYAAIISCNDAERLLSFDPGQFPIHVGKTQQRIQQFDGRRGSARFFYQNEHNELFDFVVDWSVPNARLDFVWYSIPDETAVATARVAFARTTNGGFAVEKIQWDRAIQLLNEWTKPGWFRCHGCGKRRSRSAVGVGVVLDEIFVRNVGGTTNNSTE